MWSSCSGVIPALAVRRDNLGNHVGGEDEDAFTGHLEGILARGDGFGSNGFA